MCCYLDSATFTGIVRKKCVSFSDNTEFANEDGSDNLRETVEANYKRVKQEVLSLIELEIERIKTNPSLSYLIKE